MYSAWKSLRPWERLQGQKEPVRNSVGVVDLQTGEETTFEAVASFRFSADGAFQNSWGEQWAEGAHGLTLSKEGDTEYLYLATTKQATVVKTTPRAVKRPNCWIAPSGLVASDANPAQVVRPVSTTGSET